MPVFTHEGSLDACGVSQRAFTAYFIGPLVRIARVRSPTRRRFDEMIVVAFAADVVPSDRRERF